MSFTCILGVVVAYWMICSLFALYIVKKAIKTYRNHPIFEVPEHYQSLMRQDFNKWDEAAIIRGCFWRFPIKFAFQFLFLFWLSIFSILNLKFNFPCTIVEFVRISLGRLSNIVMFEIEEHFDWRQKITTPIVIANHTTMMDGNYLGGCFRCLSAISKDSIKNTPLFGNYMKYSKCIFVNRESGGKGAILRQIKNRVQQFQKATDDSVFPILIFPEGTCSNGRAILQFKNGAFENMTPITVFSMRYQCKEFHMAQDEINPFYLLMIQLCLNPKIIIKKKVVQPQEGETVEKYRERCRDLLLEMTNFKKYEANYNDFIEYERQKKEIIEARKKQNKIA